jgi:hypothetical protein
MDEGLGHAGGGRGVARFVSVGFFRIRITEQLSLMCIAVASRSKKKPRGRGRPRADIQLRLEDIELATVSAVRALQMDIDGDLGVPSATVLRKARLAIR